MTGREKIEAAFSPAGAREAPAVICYERLCIRDHWDELTDCPWWYQYSGDLEHQLAWRRDTIARMPQDWFRVWTGPSRCQQDRIVIEERREGVFRVDRRAREEERLTRPLVGGWNADGRSHHIAPPRLPESIEEVDASIPAAGGFDAERFVAEGQGDWARALVDEFGGERFPFAHVLSAASGQGLAAEPGSPGVGVVQVPWDRFELLLSPNAESTRVEGSKGLCTVPAGRYKLVYITLKAVDENGGEWQMRNGYRTRRALVVRPGRTTRISVCPPFTARLRVSRHRVVGGQVVTLHLQIVDEEGCFYRVPRPTRAGASGPQVTLVDSKGNQVDACTLEYPQSRGVWRVPEDLSGLLIVKTTLPESPFDISVPRPCRILVSQPGEKPEGRYRLLREPIVQVAAQPTGMNAVELLWEVNDMPPYDPGLLRAITAVFTPDGQAEFLKDKFFDILASLDGTTFVKIATVKGPTNRYFHRGVRAGWLYYYKVRAYDAARELMAESAVTLGADGPNLVEDPGFEQRPLGPVPDKDNQPVHEDKCYPAKGFAVVKGSRPYSQGAKILKFDPAWAGREQVSFYGNLIALSADKTYLQGGWVRAPGEAMLGRFFYDGDKKTISWAYAIMWLRETPEWTFGVQFLVPDRDKTGFKRNEDGRVFGMAQKHWNFPPEAKYMSAFVTSFDAGECDDHWVVEVSKAPPGTSAAPAAAPAAK